MKKLILASLFISLLTTLHAQRDRVQIQDGTIVTDKGTLIRGAYHSTDVSDEAPSKAYITAMKNFGLNCIHVYGECPEFNTVGEKIAMIDSLVKWTGDDSLYLVLTIGGGFTQNGQFDSAFVMDFWNIYAPRYKDETHVIYEICNEPFSWSSPYDSATLSMERWAYDTIRALAPETHILFMSYACAVNPDSVINDINQLGSGIDWNNASIAIHGYGTASENVRNFIQTIQNLGYAITNTEPPSIENYYVNLATTRIFEEEFVSYLHFVSAERISNDPSAFKSGIESSEIRWTPDFGTWPESLVEIDYRDPYQEFRAGFYDKGFGVNLLNLDSRIGYINHDDYVAYYNFDFEDGPDSVIIKASCDNTSSGSIKLFLDSLDGQLIGTYPIGYTGSWDNYERFSFPINASFNGVHKIYFLFYADHEWDIMNLESIQFKQNEVSSVRESAYSGDGIIRIYPNPASNYLTIQSPGEGSIEIYAIQGRLLQEIKLSDTSNTIAVDHFKRGNYVIRVVTKNEVYSKIINIR